MGSGDVFNRENPNRGGLDSGKPKPKLGSLNNASVKDNGSGAITPVPKGVAPGDDSGTAATFITQSASETGLNGSGENSGSGAIGTTDSGLVSNPSTSSESTLRQPTPTSPLELTGAGAGASAGVATIASPTDTTQPSFTPQPTPSPTAPYANTIAITNPGLDTFNGMMDQGKPLGWALSNSVFSPYAQSHNSLEAVSNSDTLLTTTNPNGGSTTFGNIAPTDIKPLYTAIDNNTGNLAFLNLNRNTSLTVTDINGISNSISDISSPVLTNRLTPPPVVSTIPDINATISRTTTDTTTTTIDSIGRTPLSNSDNSNIFNSQQPLVNNNPLNVGLEASNNAQPHQIIKTGIETSNILNPNLISANNNNEIASATERTSLTFTTANPNQQPLAATPLMNNLLNGLNISPKTPLTNISDALNNIIQRPPAGLNDSLQPSTGQSPLSPGNIANTMHNLVENTVNFILGRPNDFIDSSTGIGALSAQANSNLFTILVGLSNLNNNPNADIADARFDQLIRNMNTTKSMNTSDNGSAITADISGIPQIILPNLKNIEKQNDLTITINNLQLPHDLQQLLLIDKLTNVKEHHSGIKIDINSKEHQLAILKALNTLLNPNAKIEDPNPLSKVLEHLLKDADKNKLEALKLLIEKQMGKDLKNEHGFDKPYLKDKTRTTLLLSELLTASLINKNNVLKDTSNNFKQFVNLLLTKLDQKHNNTNDTKLNTSQKALNILTKTYNTNEMALKNTLKMFSANFENLLTAKMSNRQIPGKLASESNNLASHDFTNLFLLNLKNTQGRLFTDKTVPNENRAQHLNMDFKASMSLFVNLLMESMASSLNSNRLKQETNDKLDSLADFNFDASAGIGALSASLVHNLLIKAVKHIAWIDSFKLNALKLDSFRLAPNSYVNLALVMGLFFQLLNPLLAFAYKDGDFPGVGNETDWDNANQYYNQGNHTKGEAACQLYLKAISIYPYDAGFWTNLGYKTKDSNKKIEYSQKAIELNPESADPYIGLGVTYTKLGRHEDAIACYLKALKLEPNNEHLYDSIGNEYGALKKYKEAMPYFQRLTELNPKLDEGYNNLGYCYDRLNNFSRAIELYKQALIINPTYWPATENIGLVLYRMGKIKEGLSFKDKAYSLAKSKKDKDVIIKDFENAKAGIYQ